MSSAREEMPGPTRPTLEMVAAAAGVSRGTASRALNGGQNVSRRALEAVEQAAAALGYRPNLAARSLVLGRSESVGLVVSEPDDRLFTDPFFPAVVRALHSELATSGTQLVLTLAQTDEERAQVVRFAAGRHLDGVVLISMHGVDPLPRDLAEAGIPVVIAGRGSAQDDAAGISWVDADNRGGARLAVAHLYARGRRRIATLAGPADMAPGRDRLEGWRLESVARLGVADPGLIERCDFTEDAGDEAMERLLAREPDLDAVFAASDLIALGALTALRRAGRRVPDDVALVGFDNIPAAERSDPPLTTVVQPVAELGRLVARMLMRKVRGEDGVESQLVLPTHLVVRDSA